MVNDYKVAEYVAVALVNDLATCHCGHVNACLDFKINTVVLKHSAVSQGLLTRESELDCGFFGSQSACVFIINKRTGEVHQGFGFCADFGIELLVVFDVFLTVVGRNNVLGRAVLGRRLIKTVSRIFDVESKALLGYTV